MLSTTSSGCPKKKSKPALGLASAKERSRGKGTTGREKRLLATGRRIWEDGDHGVGREGRPGGVQKERLGQTQEDEVRLEESAARGDYEPEQPGGCGPRRRPRPRFGSRLSLRICTAALVCKARRLSGSRRGSCAGAACGMRCANISARYRYPRANFCRFLSARLARGLCLWQASWRHGPGSTDGAMLVIPVPEGWPRSWRELFLAWWIVC